MISFEYQIENIDDCKFNEIKRTKYMIKQILLTLDWHSIY